MKAQALAVVMVVGCGGAATDEEAAESVAECVVLETATVYSQEACYSVPAEPPLAFGYFQGIGCAVLNNGREVDRFTQWDILEPGVLDVAGCEFRMLIVPGVE